MHENQPVNLVVRAGETVVLPAALDGPLSKASEEFAIDGGSLRDFHAVAGFIAQHRAMNPTVNLPDSLLAARVLGATGSRSVLGNVTVEDGGCLRLQSSTKAIKLEVGRLIVDGLIEAS